MSIAFHAGMNERNGTIKTNGGRVMAITSLSDQLAKSLALSKKTAEHIQFDGKYYRKDIGYEFS